MNLIFHNLIWMTGNILLAVLAVVFGWLSLKTESPFLKLIFGILWLLFIPNTIYILTDLIHVSKQLSLLSESSIQAILISQYALLALLGLWTFILGLYPFEKFVKGIKLFRQKASYYALIIITNFVVAFGVVIGRIQRTYSWEVFTNPIKVAGDISNVLRSSELIMLVIFFGMMGNLLYFSIKTYALRITSGILTTLLLYKHK